jgi:hypothetical protein
MLATCFDSAFLAFLGHPVGEIQGRETLESSVTLEEVTYRTGKHGIHTPQQRSLRNGWPTMGENWLTGPGSRDTQWLPLP